MRSSVRPERNQAWPIAWLTACTLFAAAQVHASTSDASNSGFLVRHANTRLVDGVYLLDADIAFRFSPESMEAMRNGVSLTVLIEMEVLRERRWWDTKVASVQARYRIETHALTKHYVVRNLNTGEARTFRDFGRMAEALGRIADLPMLDKRLLDADKRYKARLRVRLDIEALPSPLRPLAYLSSRWRHKSAWYVWPINR